MISGIVKSKTSPLLPCKDDREGSFYATRFASPQGSLIPLNPQESLVRQPRLPFPAQQLWLFEWVQPA
jgi:hypothetical protein